MTYDSLQISARRGSIVGHQSASSRAASIADDDEDDGFYDNIGTYDDRRISRSSEMDVVSLSSHQLPPTGWKPTKIGSFLRKIGGGNRPPGSAASLVSLNKVANETPMKQGNLMKSNSLSNEPWKKMVIDNPSIPKREPFYMYERAASLICSDRPSATGLALCIGVRHACRSASSLYERLARAL
ncbi:hypothetical protein TELCIR_21509 [Teladorsagia circumcincta]|uniref:Uncharacterized protein n=1 Tax=Teladorsagia circumcincta TaxID=45464 RepID=A0A2G9TGQ6_TELCI|nr:hypothetical protein TELCIR_21509 [Teladorsagia circumcincta]